MKPGKLIEAVNELNQVVKLQEPLKIKKDKDELARDLYGALSFIEPGDNFSGQTEKVFKKLKKQFNKTVEVGDTVDFEVTDNKRKKVMSKKDKSAKGANVELITALLNPKIKRDEMWDFVRSDKAFKKRKKELLEITNSMSLKSQMLKEFDKEEVDAIRATLPKTTRKPKEEKVDEETQKLINSVKSATKRKQLKKVAKENDVFDWKDLKSRENFTHLQNAMLKVLAPKQAKPEKVMIKNPLIAEIEAFTKTKKLKKWAAEKDEFANVKIKKSMDIEEAQEALIEVIPAEIEKPKASRGERRPSNWAERKDYFTELVEEGAYNRQELMEKLTEKFPGQEKSHSNMLSEVKNEKYAGRYKLKALVVESKKGKYKFAK